MDRQSAAANMRMMQGSYRSNGAESSQLQLGPGSGVMPFTPSRVLAKFGTELVVADLGRIQILSLDLVADHIQTI